MTSVTEPLAASNRAAAAALDGEFLVCSKLVLEIANDAITMRETVVPPFLNQYPLADVTAAEGFVARTGKAISGRILLSESWNRYARIDDLTVDRSFRRQGIAHLLLMAAAEWARARGLPKLFAETQDNNVAACRLYERAGFRLAGFDRELYRALAPETEEIALFWYCDVSV